MSTETDTAIVRPFVGRKSPRLEGLAVVVSNDADLRNLCGRLPVAEHPVRLMMSRLMVSPDRRCAIVGPAVGAPYAVMLMEPLIAWGAREVLFIGWCGAISPAVGIGDIIVPHSAIIDEGTSLGYGAAPLDIVPSSATLRRRVAAALAARGRECIEGRIWSTDAIYRETPEKVARFRARHALAVEMELSALFTVGRFRNIPVGAALVVSDDLTRMTWKPGFKDERFRGSRRILVEVIKDLCLNPR